MDEWSLYQRLLKERREVTDQRKLEDTTLKDHEDKTYSDIKNRKDAEIAEHNGNAQKEKTELEERENAKWAEMKNRHCLELKNLTTKHEREAADMKRARESAMDTLSANQTTALKKLENSYEAEEDRSRAEIEDLKITLENDRANDDAKLSKKLLEALDEENNQTIEVDSPGVSISNAEQSFQQIVNFKTRLAASSTEQSPMRQCEQQSSSNESGQTPRSHLQVSSRVTPTKRSMADSPSENRQPPSLRRVVSENVRPKTLEDVFSSSSPPASSNLSIYPKTFPSATPDLQPASSFQPIFTSSASPGSSAQGSLQNSQPVTPQANHLRTIVGDGSPKGMSLEPPVHMNQLLATPSRLSRIATPPSLQSPFNPGSQRRSLSCNTPRHTPRSSPQQNPSPASAKQGRLVCANFEITSVRYNYADGANVSWTREAEEGPRFYRLRDNKYQPVQKHGRQCGSAEWIINPSRVWSMKYNSKAALLYINRRKADPKTGGNAGKEMWVKFKDEVVLEEFLKSYRENWEHIKIDELDLDDDEVPLSMAKSCR
ncbi:hypothetical protein BKA64DRAFT_633907 [Cadophora sp. MPI-SDFR-AT-0126]|nr:hypothetical protein BKA64DRAFT_633907 [Leotiomycetes sp. MPI-SDFR-AT-0126]